MQSWSLSLWLTPVPPWQEAGETGTEAGSHSCNFPSTCEYKKWEKSFLVLLALLTIGSGGVLPCSGGLSIWPALLLPSDAHSSVGYLPRTAPGKHIFCSQKLSIGLK